MVFRVLCLLLLCLLPNVLYAQSQDSKDTVYVQLKWLHQFQFAGLYMAIEKGFYAEHGLDVRLIERDKGLSPVEALQKNKAQYAISDSTAIISRSKGFQCKLWRLFFSIPHGY